MSEIGHEFRLVLCDLWGVIHDGRQVFPDAVACLRRFKQSGSVVYLVSNAPRPSSAVVPQLRQLGVDDLCYHGVVTSGDITRAALNGAAPFDNRNTGRAPFAPPGSACLHIGPERDLALFEGLECVRLAEAAETALGQADFILCTGLFNDDAETAADYRPLLSDAVNRGLVMICANPDLIVVRGSTLIPCAGAIAAEYELLGGTVRYFGKPYPEIYDFCLDRWRDDAGPGGDAIPLKGRQVLSIGDSFRTDIAGARNMGFRSVLITSGIHSEEFGVEPGHLPSQEKIDAVCESANHAPDMVMATLAW